MVNPEGALGWYIEYLLETRVSRFKKRGLLVGQAPGRNKCDKPWCCRPMQGLAERKVAKLAGLKDTDELWERFQRMNLVNFHPGRKPRKKWHLKTTGYTKHNGDGDTFPFEDAKRAAETVRLEDYSCAILLGLNVARCFMKCIPGLKVELLHQVWYGDCLVIVYPHPSGISHYWNDKENTRIATKALRDLMEDRFPENDQEQDAISPVKRSGPFSPIKIGGKVSPDKTIGKLNSS